MRPKGRIGSARVDEVRRRLDRWRRGHRPPTPIPEDLWAEAVELAGQDGAYGTSRALGLNYQSLRKRLEAAGPEGTSVQDGRAAFVEIVPLAGANGISECLVELEDGGGAKMKIQLKGARSPEIVSLTTALWRGAR